MNKKQFISEARKKLKAHGIKCKLTPYKRLRCEDGTFCSGYFDEDGKILAVATDKPEKEWFETFIHEFCHFEQWNEKDPIWDSCYLKNGSDVLDLVMQDFRGDIKLGDKKITRYLDLAAKLEKDCEIRALDKIKSYKLLKDVRPYTKKANSYITFYYTMRDLRSWCKTPPYKVKPIIDVMPSRIKGINHKKLATKYLELYREYCI